MYICAGVKFLRVAAKIIHMIYFIVVVATFISHLYANEWH